MDGLRYDSPLCGAPVFGNTKNKKSPGRKNKLKKNQKTELKEMILEGPEKNGYKTGIWTAAIIQELINL